MFNENHPNAVHQADLLFLPHDQVNRKTFKNCLTIVDVGSRFKAAEPLVLKESNEVPAAMSQIYKRDLSSGLIFFKQIQVANSKEPFRSCSVLTRFK